MILSSDHATIHADVLVADHAYQVVLLSMAGPKTAVKAIYAALRSNHQPWLKLYEGSVDPTAVVRGGLRYRTQATPLPSVRSVQMVIVADDDRAPAGYFYVTPEVPAGRLLVQALDADPRLVIPVLPEWGEYLLKEAQETLADFPDECSDVPDRLVESLQVHGGLLADAYVYARDNDTWLNLVNRGLESGAIVLDAALGSLKEFALSSSKEPALRLSKGEGDR